MIRVKENFFFIILAVFFSFSVIAIYNLSLRPTLPLPLKSTDNGIVFEPGQISQLPEIAADTLIITLNNKPVKSINEVDEIADRSKIGDKILVGFSNGQILSIKLIARNSWVSLFLNGLLALSFFIISGIVWRYASRASEKFFALTALLFGYILAMGWPGMILPPWISSLLVILYFISYPQAFLSFLYFSYQFPASTLSPKNLKTRQFILFSLGLGLSFFLVTLFFEKYLNPSAENIDRYHGFYRIFRAFILVSLVYSLSLFIHNFKKEPTPVNRQKVQWVLWGIIWGSFPFIFLWNLPQIFGLQPFIPEWIYMIFLLLTPASVTIAILRYRLFDIEIVLSRSLVYSLMLGSLIGIYLIFIGSLSLLLQQQFSFYRYPVISIVSAAVLALVFNPLRLKAQTVIDKKFFRIRYDRFQMLHEFMDQLDNFSLKYDILAYLSKTFSGFNPVQEELMLVKKGEKWEPRGDPPQTFKSVIEWMRENIDHLSDNIILNQEQSQKIEEGLNFPRISLPLPVVVLIPIGKLAWWGLGEKKAGNRFWKEDIDLIQEMVRAAKLQLEKIEYIELSLSEALQKEQAQEQSEWRKLLISEIAHDLRSPLNTIQWRLKNVLTDFEDGHDLPKDAIENLKNQILFIQKSIESLLLYAELEYGKQEIKLYPVPIQSEIKKCLIHLEELISQKELKIDIQCNSNLRIRSEPNLFQIIIMNISQNAIKYSPAGGQITIRASTVQSGENSPVLISIQDEAGGISKEILDNIFIPLGDKKVTKSFQKGFHLGLYIANAFMKILRGEIKIDSVEGKGTTVILTFPGVKKHQQE